MTTRKPRLVRVFVGASPDGQDAEACATLARSILARTQSPVKINWLVTSRRETSPLGGWRTEMWRTPWTALRWAVPELCGFEGRAVYFDCPTLVLGDVAEAAEAPMSPEAMMLARRTPRGISTACLVFDCRAAAAWLPSLADMKANIQTHRVVGALLEKHPEIVDDLPEGWGADDAAYSAAPAQVTGSVHFSNLRMAPHMRLAVGRLARAGRKHWHDEVLLPHYCAGLVSMYEEEMAAARAEGYTIDKYGAQLEGAET